MSGNDDFGLAPRIVKPRTCTYALRPVVAISGETALDEQGEVQPAGDIVKTLHQREPTLFAKLNAADFVAEINEPLIRRHGDKWQWRASTHERDIVRHDGHRVASRVSTVIHFFGFKGGNYHKIIDPVVMYGHRLDRIWPGDDDRLVKLLEWAVTLRDFCEENSMDVRPTIGGISAQFLTDRRFYSQPRRKVPAKINERVRDELPGNHYVLTVYPSPRREFQAIYLDQHRAHHYHARTTPMPNSNHLYAHGFFLTLDRFAFKDTWDDFYGLYCLSLTGPPGQRRSHWIRNLDKAFVYSNELQHLRDMGYTVNGVYAAWGACKRDIGLARYATWANRQLDHYGDKPWLKPLLLSTYGVLATRPKQNASVFRLAKREDIVTLCTGHGELTGKLAQQKRKLEPRIANVLHRGMIEAATRSESVGYAQYLSHIGYRVLSIYADAVIVERDKAEQLADTPPLTEPWRIKTTLTHLQFVNQQAFLSGEMTKLPGVNRELQGYRQSNIGRAPRVKTYDALTNQTTQTDRRI